MFLSALLVTHRSIEATLEDTIHTSTDYTSPENVVVTVSIPVSVAHGHEVRITLIPRPNRIEVNAERIPVNHHNQSGNEVPLTPTFAPADSLQPQVSRLSLNDEPRTPSRRNNNTVAFDMRAPGQQSPSARPRHPVTAPSTPASARSSRWVNAVDVSEDEEFEELMPVYPPPYGQREVVHHNQGDGRRYYVVTKGKRIGVFYAHWYVVHS